MDRRSPSRDRRYTSARRVSRRTSSGVARENAASALREKQKCGFHAKAEVAFRRDRRDDPVIATGVTRRPMVLAWIRPDDAH
jgi:hypothetical protein